MTTQTSGVQVVSEMVRCMCCNTPVAERRGADLIIIQRHHGEKHTTTIALVDSRMASVTQ